MYIAKDVTPAVARRLKIERTIVRRVVKDALAAGYTLSVDDGGDEYAVENTTSYRAVMDALMNTDDDKLILRKDGKGGKVWFVYGNSGWDVICDYTTSLEALIEPLMAAGGLIDKMERRASR